MPRTAANPKPLSARITRNTSENPPKSAAKASPPTVDAEQYRALEEKSLNLEAQLRNLSEQLQKVSLEKEQKIEEAQHALDEQKRAFDAKIRQLARKKGFVPTLEENEKNALLGMPLETEISGKKEISRPKRPASAYNLFCAATVEKVRAEQPDLKFEDVSKRVAELWREIPPAEKEALEVKAKADRERYDKEMEKFRALKAKEEEQKKGLELLQGEKKRQAEETLAAQYVAHLGKNKTPGKPGKMNKAKAHDPNKPKKWMSAYMHFAVQKRKEMIAAGTPARKATFGEIGKRLGEDWKELSATEKAVFEKLAEEDQARWTTEMEAYKAKCAEEAKAQADEMKKTARKLFDAAQNSEEALKLLKQQRKEQKLANKEARALKKEKKEKMKDHPKRPQNAYMMFCNDERKDVQAKNPGLAPPEVSKLLGAQWKAMPEEQKEQYQERAALDRVRYVDEMVEYKAKQGPIAPTA